MMQISITKKVYEKELVDVTFPIYRKFELDSTTLYTKITEDLKAVTIDVPHNNKEVGVEIIDKYEFDNFEADYHLGLGIYSSSEREWMNMCDKIEKFLSPILTKRV